MRLIQAGQITDGTGHIYTWQLATHMAAYWSNRLHCMNIDIYVFVIVIHATVGMIGEAPVEPVVPSELAHRCTIFLCHLDLEI